MKLEQKDYTLLAKAFDISSFVKNTNREDIKKYVNYTRLTQSARQDLLLNKALVDGYFKDDINKIIDSLDNSYLVGLYRRLYLKDENHFMLPAVLAVINKREFNYTYLCRLVLIRQQSWSKVHSLRLLEFAPIDIRFISCTVSIPVLFDDLVSLCNSNLDAGREAVSKFIDKMSYTISCHGKSRLSSEFRSYAITMKAYFTGVHIDLPMMEHFAGLYTPKTAISLVAKAIAHIEEYPDGRSTFGTVRSAMVQHGLASEKPMITVSPEALDWAIKTHTMSVLSGKSAPVEGRLSKNIDIIKKYLK